MTRRGHGWILLLILVAMCQVARHTLRSDGPAQVPPPPDPAQVKRVSDSVLAFSLDLYGTQRDEPGNLFFSPFSLSEALGILAAGAQEQTLVQIHRVTHLPGLPGERRLSLSALAPRELDAANAVWVQRGFPLLGGFIAQMRDSFDAPLEQVDFVGDADRARAAINRWVKRQTRGRVREVLPAGALDEQTRLVLVDAVHFKADWAHPFDAAHTRPQPFTRLDRQTVTVPMMRQEGRYAYAEGDGWQAVELPYQGERLAMVAILPPLDQYAAFEQRLTVERLQAMVGRLQGQDVSVVMPRFSLTCRLPAKAALQRLGMVDAFNRQAADFSGVDGRRDLWVGEVLHQAFVKVNEQGTEAGAASGSWLCAAKDEEGPRAVRLDHPFVFLIRDRQTGLVLFLGRVLDPRG